MNLQRNSSFINQTRFPLLCEKSGAMLLVLVGLTAGRQLVDLKIFKFSTGHIVRIFTNEGIVLLQCYYSVTNAFQLFFWVKYVVGCVMEARESRTPCFLESIPIMYYRT